jgi:hypothetical protein
MAEAAIQGGVPADWLIPPHHPGIRIHAPRLSSEVPITIQWAPPGIVSSAVGPYRSSPCNFQG